MYAVCPARAVWTSRGAASSVCVRTDACVACRLVSGLAPKSDNGIMWYAERRARVRRAWASGGASPRAERAACVAFQRPGRPKFRDKTAPRSPGRGQGRTQTTVFGWNGLLALR